MRKQVKDIEFKSLSSVYKEVVKNLNRVYERENDGNYDERKFINLFSACSKLIPYRNMWIGRRNIDFLFPQIKLITEGRKFFGIAFEVNGGVHNAEFKMKKDEFKDRALLEANIYPVSIDTENIYHNHTLSILEYIFRLPTVDTRGKKRVLRNIYIKTILANRTNEQLSKLFSYKDSNYLISLRSSFNAWCGKQRQQLLELDDNHEK